MARRGASAQPAELIHFPKGLGWKQGKRDDLLCTLLGTSWNKQGGVNMLLDVTCRGARAAGE